VAVSRAPSCASTGEASARSTRRILTIGMGNLDKRRSAIGPWYVLVRPDIKSLVVFRRRESAATNRRFLSRLQRETPVVKRLDLPQNVYAGCIASRIRRALGHRCKGNFGAATHLLIENFLVRLVFIPNVEFGLRRASIYQTK
jgi:hypothetical protein